VAVAWTKIAGGGCVTQFDVTLAGEANLDLLLYGLPEELPLERELIADRMAMTLGGSPAITAHNLAALGSRTAFITSSAGDLFSSICLKELAEAGVDLSRIVRTEDGGSAGISVLLQHLHSRRTFTYRGTTHDLRFEDLDLDYLTAARHFHLSSYFLQEHLRKDVPRLFVHLKRAGLTISLDPNDDPSGSWDESLFEVLKHVDVFLPNEREVCHLMRESDPGHAIRRLGERLPLLVVKRGSRGAVAVRDGVRFEAEAIQVESVDAVGAGDSFNAGFLHAFLKDWPLEGCLHFGNLTGAFSTTVQGGVQAFRDRGRLDSFIASHSSPAPSLPVPSLPR
jgi:sugar/nucleoside kinase (ribokinase family)